MQGAEVLTRFTADTKEMEKAEKDVQSGFERTRQVAEVAFGAAVAAIDKMVSAFVAGGIEYNSQVETYLTRLTTLTGSTEKAHEILEQIKKDALATPFEVSSLTSAESLLLATGMGAEQARGDILALGDALAASGGGNQELSRMAVNLQQIKNVGKATALDIKQFAYAGIDIFGLLADSLGITREEAADLDVTYEMLSNALQNASKEGGKYYKAMEKQSTTYAGAMSNLEESVQVFKGAIAEGLFNVLKDIIPPITEMFNWLTKNKEIVLAITIPLLTFINILTGFLIVKKIAAAFAILNAALMANPIFLVIAAIAALMAAFVYLWNNCEAFRNFWIDLWNGIVDTAKGVINWFMSIPEIVGNIINGIIDFIKNLPYYIGYAIGWIVGKLIKFYTEDVPNFINAVVTWFQELPGKIWNALVTAFNKMVTWLTNLYNKCKEAIPELVKSIIDWFKKLPGDMLNIGKSIVEGLWKGIKNAKDWVVGKVKDFAKGILDGMKKALGIHSPSTEFAMIGKFSVLGYTEELDKMTKTVQGQIAETFSVSPQLANSSSLHYSPNVVVNTVNNISQDPLGRMVNDIKTFSGGAKNDYNYGMGV